MLLTIQTAFGGPPRYGDPVEMAKIQWEPGVVQELKIKGDSVYQKEVENLEPLKALDDENFLGSETVGLANHALTAEDIEKLKEQVAKHGTPGKLEYFPEQPKQLDFFHAWINATGVWICESHTEFLSAIKEAAREKC